MSHQEINLQTERFTVTSGKQVRLPDPYERTRNDPLYLMSSNDVLKLVKDFYKENHTLWLAIAVTLNSGKEVITESSVEPIIAKAKAMGWGNVKLVGKQLKFIAYF